MERPRFPADTVMSALWDCREEHRSCSQSSGPAHGWCSRTAAAVTRFPCRPTLCLHPPPGRASPPGNPALCITDSCPPSQRHLYGTAAIKNMAEHTARNEVMYARDCPRKTDAYGHRRPGKAWGDGENPTHPVRGRQDPASHPVEAEGRP